MRIAPILSCLLWSIVGVGCGDDPTAFIDARGDDASIDDAEAIDAAPDAATDAATDATLAPVATLPGSASVGTTCGVSTPPTTDITVGNTGNGDLTISAASASGGFTVVTTLPLTVTPGNTAMLTIRAPVAVIGTDLGGSTKTGTLTLTTNQAGASPTVTLSSLVTGANLVTVNSGGTAITMFAFSSGSTCPAPQTVYVRNTGNAAATISPTSSSSFMFSGWSPSSTVSAGSTVTQSVRLDTLSSQSCSGTGTISYQATGSICTSLPLALNATYNISGQSACFCS